MCICNLYKSIKVKPVYLLLKGKEKNRKQKTLHTAHTVLCRKTLVFRYKTCCNSDDFKI